MCESLDHLHFLAKIQVLYEALEDSSRAQKRGADWVFFLKDPLKNKNTERSEYYLFCMFKSTSQWDYALSILSKSVISEPLLHAVYPNENLKKEKNT